MENSNSNKGPLQGIKVLDLTIAMAGPLCTQRLGEMGADIIKIEAPGGGDFSRHAPMADVTKFGDATCYVTLNQNKRSLVMDLKSEEGRNALYRLVKQADVLVQNFRPRVAKKLGIDFESLSAINPSLVVGSISGYGSEGPMKDRPGQDLLLQAFTGLTMHGGREDGLPMPSPLYMVDVTASHMLCEGVLAALIARSRTQVGEEVSVTMMGAIMEMQCQEIATWFASDTPPKRSKAPHVSIYQEPPYGIYQCQSGYFAIAQADLSVLAQALEKPELETLKSQRPSQSDIDDMCEWRDQIYFLVADTLKTRSAQDWDELLTPLGVWCNVVNSYQEFLSHPQTAPHITTIEHPIGGKYKAVSPAIRFGEKSRSDLTHAPLYGEHSVEVLTEFGFSKEETQTLLEQQVIHANK
ncbi:putative Formyl-CoA oxalate CoA-transferase [Vibrio nigripulchritudo SFn27]|uniref:Putative Formyl-CoA oxalate CoA-transferase n=1 Tax=Vibrio nigripulchritudo TaxID=28173 RepID=U4JY44_9VIBR|nr:CaiB/BaiF CoA-transferase family protein [Vibrio nigripulchritudo]CCN84122.1 putative Formyl-CoA oxalate CoA-transferase [Vibrio nigripulchritudo BLFn1]CCN87037.1 putative Formyl-CoA oxalate CoA-transferase [Vibrio nigripulchritudo SFn27]CCN93258.1 putative Formyl-CoA oxalate CoA-transferase [Vibrio nigripulchritudo ENn2]CCO39452.1 putative Formyl-CoA oxalate CoA-transferase [Vibrio nigripulchritudo SFn135]CCO54294.1 putative Formyl-CoA oxalate CoA-transferase [Vibrio nigripulchritudo Wn13]